MITGFQKLEKLFKEKSSRLCLGLDPGKEEVEASKAHGGLENYLKHLIDECAEYIVAIKPQLAFYEASPEWRKIAMNVMDYANEKHDLVRILDVKRGDIANTQSHWARADLNNFNPDIVVVNAYMGGVDVVMPYLNEDPKLCVYVLTATSNPGARDFQDLLCGGLTNYQQMALHCRKLDPARIGYVMGSTKPDAIKNIRMLEREVGLTQGHALCPGFGTQGGSLEHVKYAGVNALYPISSGLSKSKNPREVAKKWRDDINAAFKTAIPTPTLKEYVVSQLVEKGLIIAPNHDDVARWPLLKRGRDKIKKFDVDSLRAYLTDGTLTKEDFTDLFMNFRDMLAHPELRRLFAFLYMEMIKASGIHFDRLGSVAYGAINTGDLVSYFMDKPAFLLRKERGAEATHADILGEIKKGETVILVEDVATTGNSAIRDIKMLRETFGVKVTDVFIFIKRTEEAEANYAREGIKLHYVFDMAQLRKMIGKESK